MSVLKIPILKKTVLENSDIGVSAVLRILQRLQLPYKRTFLSGSELMGES